MRWCPSIHLYLCCAQLGRRLGGLGQLVCSAAEERVFVACGAAAGVAAAFQAPIAGALIVIQASLLPTQSVCCRLINAAVIHYEGIAIVHEHFDHDARVCVGDRGQARPGWALLI